MCHCGVSVLPPSRCCSSSLGNGTTVSCHHGRYRRCRMSRVHTGCTRWAATVWDNCLAELESSPWGLLFRRCLFGR
ncbi:hypothetical protein OH76DRAFT_1132509 [Lentinus brumalis]|uniref:Uncharacterized protein n=1 Tax=Lentinus brumalis TaxID=2498619 RepID=A0A371CUI5_9APHY|nr:hypothetical protein OH76DRAFT_1132509 [Polyporus brumalis]